MRFTEVNEVPKPKRGYHHLKEDLERFVQSRTKIVKIEFHGDEYKSPKIAAGCLKVAIKRHHFTGIEVFLRGNDVYLENNNL